MYNQGDAVARLDSFVITVAGAGAAGRSAKLIGSRPWSDQAAVAALVDGPRRRRSENLETMVLDPALDGAAAEAVGAVPAPVPVTR